MESESEQIKWCDCGCGSDCCPAKLENYKAWIRTTKRKLDERDDDELHIPGVSVPDVARVDIANECIALREMVSNQQQTIQELIDELDEERNAASSAANEAMSMILRLQSEKAEVQMEARQFKRFSEEKMAHDQQELMALEDFLYKREQTIQALTCEVHAYKHRMLSFGLTESEADGENGHLIRNDSTASQFDFPPYNYPPLKCISNENHSNQELENETVDIEERVEQLESSPVLEKVIVGSFTETKQDLESDYPKVGSNKMQDYSNSASESGDDMTDRIYTVDSIHNSASFHSDIGDTEVKKLYARINALEADRESMKHALMSMRTDKAQMVLLKEIAQHLSKDMSLPPRLPVKKPSMFQKFSFLALFKWIASFLFWRRRARRSKYTFGMSSSNVGLRMVIDKGPQRGRWRCLLRTQFLKY